MVITVLLLAGAFKVVSLYLNIFTKSTKWPYYSVSNLSVSDRYFQTGWRAKIREVMREFQDKSLVDGNNIDNQYTTHLINSKASPKLSVERDESYIE